MNFQFLISKKNLKKFIEIGTLVLVFLLPWQTRWIFEQGIINGNPNEYLSLSVYFIDIFLLMLLFIKWVSILKGDNNFLPGRISLGQKILIFNLQSIFKVKFLNSKKVPFLLIIFFLTGALSFFWAENEMLAIQRLGWILLAIAVAYFVATFENKSKLVACFISGLMLSAWLGIWQFFAQSAFANKWLGLASHNIGDGGVSYLEIYNKNQEMTRWLRSYGSFDHPNVFGYVMTIAIIFVLWIFYERASKKKGKVFLYFALVSFSLGLFASLSRSAFLALALAVSVMLVRFGFLKIAKPLAVLLFVLIAVTFGYSQLIFARSDFGARLEQKSVNERALYFHQGKVIILENAFFGVGIGNYIEKLVKKNSENPAWAYQPVHNFFLLAWAEIGFFAMLSLLALFLMLGLYAWKRGVFSFAIWLSLAPPLLLDHWLWDLHFGVILLGFVVGILINKHDN